MLGLAKKTLWTHSPQKHPVMSDKPEALYIALVLSAFWLLLATPMTVVLVRFFGEIASGPSWPQYRSMRPCQILLVDLDSLSFTSTSTVARAF